MWLWRAVDDEGEVLDVLVQKRRNKAAALKLLRRLLRNLGLHPETITTDKLASYGAAVRDLGLKGVHRPGGMQANNRAENSHLPIRRRERKQQKFGAGRQTVKGLQFGAIKRRCGYFREADLVQPPPVPGGCDPAGGLAVFQVHA